MTTSSPPPTAPSPPTPPRRAVEALPAAPRPSVTTLLLLLPFRPIRAVRASDAFGWWGSLAVHVVGLVLVVAAAILPGAVAEAPSALDPAAVGRTYAELVGDMIAEATADGHALLLGGLTIVVGFLLLQCGLSIASVGLACWTARGDEPAQASWARAMRRLWRLTPHAAVMMVVVGLGWVVTFALAEVFRGNVWAWFYYGFIGLPSVTVLWSVVVVLAALRPHPVAARCRWPAACEGCGYPLLGLDREQGCPECGLAVRESIDPTARPGAWWTRGDMDGTDRLTRWWRCARGAVVAPSTLGRSLHLLAPREGHRGLFALHLVLGFMMAFPGLMLIVALFMYLDGEPLEIMELVQWLLPTAVYAGSVTVGMMVLVLVGGAGLVGCIASRVHGRNLLPAAGQAACYLGGYGVLWTGVTWFASLLMALVMYIAYEQAIGGAASGALVSIAWLLFLGVQLALLAVYLLLVWRITSAARHANW